MESPGVPVPSLHRPCAGVLRAKATHGLGPPAVVVLQPGPGFSMGRCNSERHPPKDLSDGRALGSLVLGQFSAQYFRAVLPQRPSGPPRGWQDSTSGQQLRTGDPYTSEMTNGCLIHTRQLLLSGGDEALPPRVFVF